MFPPYHSFREDAKHGPRVGTGWGQISVAEPSSLLASRNSAFFCILDGPQGPSAPQFWNTQSLNPAPWLPFSFWVLGGTLGKLTTDHEPTGKGRPHAPRTWALTHKSAGKGFPQRCLPEGIWNGTSLFYPSAQGRVTLDPMATLHILVGPRYPCSHAQACSG